MKDLMIICADSQIETLRLMEIMKTLKEEHGMRVIIGRSGLRRTDEFYRYELDHYFEDLRQAEMIKREKQKSKDFIAAKNGGSQRNGIFRNHNTSRSKLHQIMGR
jgi:hypothetical protein